MRVLLLIPLVAWLGCEVCEQSEDTALDYASDASWVCRPGAADDACATDLSAAAVLPDGTIELVPEARAEDPQAACFWIYPTVDLSLRSDVHDDFSNTAVQRGVVVGQTAALNEVCSLHAPLYRQVTLGVYANRDVEERDRCFEIAASDIKRAFTQFLADIGERPFIIGGHSQGGQVTTTVVHDVIEPDPALRARMIAATPIGWAVGVAEGSDVGGTFEQTPICGARDQTGCVIAYRSFGAGNDMLADPRERLPGLFDFDEPACTNVVADGAPLSRSLFAVNNGLVDIPAAAKNSGAAFALYRDAFTARCVRDGASAALEITPAEGLTSPVDFSRNLYSGDTGTHLLDMQFGQGDLADLLAEKIAAFAN